MVLVGLGAFVAGLTGVITEAQVTAIIGYVFSDSDYRWYRYFGNCQ